MLILGAAEMPLVFGAFKRQKSGLPCSFQMKLRRRPVIAKTALYLVTRVSRFDVGWFVTPECQSVCCVMI